VSQAAAEPDTSAVRLKNLRFGWKKDVPVLDVPHLEISRAERVFLRGPSGSGKSTLLSLIGGVASAQSGELTVLGHDMRALPPSQRDALRAASIGVIFQMFNLIPYLSVLENVLLPAQFSGERRANAGGAAKLTETARRLLDRLGIAPGMAERRVTELSVGQQQRVAAARALIGRPQLILADEPTSALDADARAAFIDLLLEECSASDATLLFVSHDLSLAGRFDRTIDLPAINRAAAPVAA
jgi:putative ABC transport system ATP-binding protein